MRTGVASGARVSGTGGGVRESEAPSPEAAPMITSSAEMALHRARVPLILPAESAGIR